jgi:hypothetical protein
MYYKFDDRLVIQKPSGNKFYFKVVNFTTDHVYPFSIPAMSIEVIANSGNYDFITNLRFDDIVKLQVSIQYSPREKAVWQNLFEGRVLTSKAQTGKRNTATIVCCGHEAETDYTLIKEAYTWAVATDTVGILTYFCNKYLTRTILNAPASTGVISQYTIKTDQKYIKDLVCDFEKLSGYAYTLRAAPVYNAAGNLTSCPLMWKPFDSVQTQKYKAIEGTPRFLEASFTADGQEVFNQIIQYGKTPEGGTQCVGSAQDNDNIALYNLRTMVEADTGLESSTLCGSFASFVLPYFKAPYESGTVTLEGTIQAQIGDLVYCKIPSIDLNGKTIDGNYRVVGVHHEGNFDQFETRLSLGKTQRSTEDYISEFARRNRLNMLNFIS